jgi:hypothetical protein
VWLAAEATAGAYQASQVSLGRFTAPRRPGSGLREVFAPVVGTLFDTLDEHAGIWIQDDRAAPSPIIGLGDSQHADLVAPALDPAGLGASFHRDVRDLQLVLEQILAPDTFASLSAIADASTGVVQYDDESWVATVCDFAAAHHRRVMDRTHIAQALMPLYLGRAASFIGKHAESSIKGIEQQLERLSRLFEDRRQYLIERWRRTT